MPLRAVLRWPRGFAIFLLKSYKLCLSPLFPAACRFHPTCSQYCREALDRYGVVKGGWMGAKRVFRCHPLRKGGFDPVP
jgi:hypothetical protein